MKSITKEATYIDTMNEAEDTRIKAGILEMQNLI